MRPRCRAAGVLIGVGGQDAEVRRREPPVIRRDQFGRLIATIGQATTALEPARPTLSTSV